MLQFPISHWAGASAAASNPSIFSPTPTPGDQSNLQPDGDYDFVYRAGWGAHRLTQFMSGSFWFKAPNDSGVNGIAWGLETSNAYGFFGAYNIANDNRFALELFCAQQEADSADGSPLFSGGSPVFTDTLDLVSDSDYMTGFDIWHHASFYIISNVTGSGVQNNYHFFHNGVEVSAYDNFDDTAGWLVIPDENDWQSSDAGRGDLYDSWWAPTKIITDVNAYRPAGSIAADGLIGGARPAVFLSGSNVQYQTNRGNMGGVIDSVRLPDESADPAFPPGAGPLALP